MYNSRTQIAVAVIGSLLLTTTGTTSPVTSTPKYSVGIPFVTETEEDNWPQWRGPTGMGISTETGLPLNWGTDNNLLWKTPIEGKGHSSPIVWDDRVFLTTAIEREVAGEKHRVVHMRDGFYDDNPANRDRYIHPDSIGSERVHTLKVIALAISDGSVIWEHVAFEGLPYDDSHRRGSFASPTPITDGEFVYAYFGAQGLYAYDLDGSLIWSQNLGEIPNFGLGDGSSPVLYGDLLIIVADRDNGDGSFIVAFDKRTGNEVWRTPRMARIQWSTPLLVNGPRGMELVVSGFQAVISYYPATGTERWRGPGLRGNVIATPVANSETVFVSVGYQRKKTYAVHLGATGKVSNTDAIAWEYEKGTAYVPSNILYGHQLYLIADNGMLTSLDTQTGKLIYEGARVPIPGRFSASPVAYDGKLLIASQDGDMFVIKAGPVHEVLAVNSIEQSIWASPAITDGKLLVRGATHIFCFTDLGE